ncbi:hypothetical protein MesoLjLa_67710 (plasmid) [Mesorhizobium sp. L-2-11]|nr:hypothetical protein MesoLjLa_67710 [Mesorhizobium sp. L-2-11]
MLPTEIMVGHVYRYSYLSHWQHREGREEAEKDRPRLGAGAGYHAGRRLAGCPGSSDHAHTIFRTP